MKALFSALVLLAALVGPAHAQIDGNTTAALDTYVSSALDAGTSPEEVMAQALAAGFTLEEVMLSIADAVGSVNVPQFYEAAARVVGAIVGLPASSPLVTSAVTSAVGTALASGAPGAPRTLNAGQGVDSATAVQRVSAALQAAQITSGFTMSSVVVSPAIVLTAPVLQDLLSPGLTGAADSGGGGGGRLNQNTLCEQIASEPGCIRFSS